MSLYRKILGQSLRISWKNKYLWFFGLFALVLAGNGAELEIFNRIFGNETGHGKFFRIPALLDNNWFSLDILRQFGNLVHTDPAALIIAVIVWLLFIALTIFVVWLVVVSQIALIKNSALVIANKENSIKSGVFAGVENFWPVFGMNLINELIISLAAFLIAWPLTLKIFYYPGLARGIVFVGTFLLFVIISMTASFAIKYAIAYKVLKSKNIKESLILGYELFRKNWLISLEMAVLLFLINFISVIIIVLAGIELAVPYLLLVRILFIATASRAFLGFMLLFGVVLFIGFVAICGSFLAVFQVSAWTSLFMELVSGGGSSKIMRIFNKYLK